MGKLSPLTAFLTSIWDGLMWFGRLLVHIYENAWGWLQLRIPFVRALVRRHALNPATIFIDIASFILAFYFIFGVSGVVLLYSKHSESTFTRNLTNLYPLPAARVNNTFIWGHKFLERLHFLTTFNTQGPKDVSSKIPTDKDLRTRVLEGLIEDKVIYLEAQSRGINVSQDELNKAFDKQGKPADIEKKIKQLYDMNLTQFKQIIAEQVLKEKVKNVVLTRVKVRHILTSTQDAAVQAKKQLDGGKDFGQVAKEFSQDAQTKDSGGDLGYWRKGELAAQIAPAFEDASFSLAVNKVSDPVQTQFGYHIIQVTERTGDNPQTYEDWFKQTSNKYKIYRYIKI